MNDTGDKYKTLLGNPEKATSKTRKWESKIKTNFKVTMILLIGLRWLLTRSTTSWLVYGCRLNKNSVPWS
jgi:hypothetical protein